MTLTANQILFNATVFIGVGAASTYSRAARGLPRESGRNRYGRAQGIL